MNHQSKKSRLTLRLVLCAAICMVNLHGQAMAQAACAGINGEPRGDASGSGAFVCGISAIANGDHSVAFGYNAWATGEFSVAIGSQTRANGLAASSFGVENDANAASSSAFGTGNDANGAGSSAFGAFNKANGEYSSAFGFSNTAEGYESSAFGAYNRAIGNYSSVFGFNSQALNIGSTAIGFGAIADRDYAVAVGKTGFENQIIHLADGTQDTDAVNLRQLNAAILGSVVDLSPFAAAFGGGAAWAGGIFMPPTYTIQGMSYGNVGAALAAIDNWMTTNANGVQYDDPSHATVTLDGAAGTQVKNVADGVDDMDAVNKGQMDAGDTETLAAAQDYADAGDAATLEAANDYTDVRETAIRTDMAAGDAATLTASKTYTDNTATQTLNSAKSYTDQKFAAWNDTFTQYQQEVDRRFMQTDARIDRNGAMQTAMAQMTASAAGVRTVNRMAVGVGAQNGKTALSVGYQRAIGERAAFTIGGAFSGNESSAGVGYGIGW